MQHLTGLESVTVEVPTVADKSIPVDNEGCTKRAYS